MEMKIVISSGENEVVLSPMSPLRLLAGGLEGFDSTGFDVVVTPTLAGNGGTVTRRRFADRRMKLRFEICDNSAAADSMWRQRIRTLMNPMSDCTVEVKIGTVCRRITAVPVDQVVFERDTLLDHTAVTLRFAAPEPFFTDTEAVRGVIPAVEVGTVISNVGDVPCGAVFTVRADGGAVIKPSISLGERTIRLNRELCDGEELVIDTRWGRKSVRINGVDCMDFDLRSSFFSLEAGENTVFADADGGKEFMVVSYEMMPLYLGV